MDGRASYLKSNALKNSIDIDLDVISKPSSLFFFARLKTKEENRKGKELKLGGPAVLSRRVGIKVPVSLFRSARKLFLSLDPLRVYPIVASHKAGMIARPRLLVHLAITICRLSA